MILIAIGSNMQSAGGMPPVEICAAAVTEMRAIPGFKFIALSDWYRTAPIPAADQQDFCNGVIRFEGDMPPESLLTVLNRIETRFGRMRGALNGPRTLDLDIIDMNGKIRAVPPPILPHPRAHLRAFVLRPVLDVAPGWRHPTLRQGVSSLLSDLSPQSIQPWFED